MNDTIIALLNNNLRVIIPDFGAFIIRQKQPRIIVFNEFLRYNDGILIDFIVKTEGIDRDIAEQRVMDFAEDGTKLLGSGRELVIEGLGSLRKESSGKISFIETPEIIEADKSGTVSPEIILEEEKQKEDPLVSKQEIPKKAKAKSTAVKKGKTVKASVKPKAAVSAAIEAAAEPAAIEPVAEPAAIEPAAEPASIEAAAEPFAFESLPAEPAALEEAIAPVAIEAASDQPVAAIETPVEPPPQIRVPGTLTQEEVDDAVAELRPEMEHVPPVQRPPMAEEMTSADRSVPVSTNRILAWVLIILFVNAIILAWFVFRKKTNGKSAGMSESAMISDTLYDQLADSVKAAAMDTSIVYTKNPENFSENPQTPGSRYYIVAGCFRDEVNADSLVNSLKNMGYKAEKFGKIGNLFAVCFASFDNKEEAVPELKKIREKVPSAWMTKF